MEEKQKIQELLKKVIAEEPNNLDKILSLTRKLALADTNKVRFSVDAGVIDRLGRELVARHETAVSELSIAWLKPAVCARRFSDICN